MTATADPDNVPPRVLLEATESELLNQFSAVTFYRDSVKLRFEAVLGSSSAIAYDYDAPFDQLLTYRADVVESGVVLDWTEAWASLAGWTGSGWSVAGGVASASSADAELSRDAAVARLEVVNPVDLLIELRLSVDEGYSRLIASLTLTNGTVTLTGTTSQTVAGSGDFTLTFSETAVSVVGTGWSASAEIDGLPDEIRLKPAPITQLASWVTSNGLYGPIALDSSGNVLRASGGTIVKYDPDGVELDSWSTPLTRVYGIAVDATDHVYVVGASTTLYKYDSAGALVTSWGITARGRSVGVDSSGTVYVLTGPPELEAPASMIRKYDSAGVAGTTWAVDAYFGIAVDAAGFVYVPDWDSQLVRKFDNSGAAVTTWDPGNAPTVLTLDPAGDVHVLTELNEGTYGIGTDAMLRKFTNAGVAINDWTLPTLPRQVAVNSTDHLFSGLDNSTTKHLLTYASVEDITVYEFDDPFSVSAEDTTTLSPTGDYAGVWLTNAMQPELALIAEAEPASSDDPYFIVSTTRQQSGLAANSVELPIEGSADVVTAVLGPRRGERWSLNIGCTTQDAYQSLVSLLANSAAINLRFPGTSRWIGLDGGFYAVGDVEPERLGHPQLGPIMVVSLPLTPSRAPAYKPLWQWNWRTVAQAHSTWAEVTATYPTWRALLVGPS